MPNLFEHSRDTAQLRQVISKDTKKSLEAKRYTSFSLLLRPSQSLDTGNQAGGLYVKKQIKHYLNFKAIH
jgi:hypothetical protein